MRALPYMQLYVGDYIADTAHLSTLQHGAYLLLIMHYWSRGGLPDDDQQLANITRMTVWEWEQNRSVLQALFLPGWKHKRLDEELQRIVDIRNKRRAAGSKGGTVTSINRFRRR